MQNTQAADVFRKRNMMLAGGDVFRFFLSVVMVILRWIIVAGRGSEKIITRSAKVRSKDQLAIAGNIIISLVLLPVVVIGRLAWLVCMIR